MQLTRLFNAWSIAFANADTVLAFTLVQCYPSVASMTDTVAKLSPSLYPVFRIGRVGQAVIAGRFSSSVLEMCYTSAPEAVLSPSNDRRLVVSTLAPDYIGLAVYHRLSMEKPEAKKWGLASLRERPRFLYLTYISA